MTQTVKNYATVLHRLGVGASAVQKARDVFAENAVLQQALSDPRVRLEQKEHVIDRLFDGVMASFLKEVCKNKRIRLILPIFDAYDRMTEEQDGILTALLLCVEPPTPEQEKKMEAFLCKRYGVPQVRLQIRQDNSLIGGFVIRCGDMEYDRSLRGRLSKLQKKLIGDVK